MDNDGDGNIDCRDSDCASKAICQGCGNGIKDGDEECDGQDFGSEFCEPRGYIGGCLACNPDCTIDESACEPPVCGDDIANGGEECNGYDMGSHASCDEQGFLGGIVLCDDETCTCDTSQCFDEVTWKEVEIDWGQTWESTPIPAGPCMDL